MLNRVVRLTEDGLEYEADPRHAEMLVLAGGLHLGNSKVAPGATEEEPDYNAILQEAELQEVRPGDLDGECPQHVLEGEQVHDEDVQVPRDEVLLK